MTSVAATTGALVSLVLDQPTVAGLFALFLSGLWLGFVLARSLR